MKDAVIRKWCATVRRADLDSWIETYRTRVLDNVKRIDGFRSVTFLAERETEPCPVTVLMEWEDMEAITRFAGDDPARAVIPDFMAQFFVNADAHAGFHDVILQEARA
ncbi:hypothetical protein [Sulfitobacter sp. JB4-11]|uniref:hypothetical protein n=1 Tax=Sulfitobacter rhodophyticola TaxID=3238304 RepID=UPI0035112023